MTKESKLGLARPIWKDWVSFVIGEMLPALGIFGPQRCSRSRNRLYGESSERAVVVAMGVNTSHLQMTSSPGHLIPGHLMAASRALMDDKFATTPRVTSKHIVRRSWSTFLLTVSRSSRFVFWLNRRYIFNRMRVDMECVHLYDGLSSPNYFSWGPLYSVSHSFTELLFMRIIVSICFCSCKVSSILIKFITYYY